MTSYVSRLVSRAREHFRAHMKGARRKCACCDADGGRAPSGPKIAWLHHRFRRSSPRSQRIGWLPPTPKSLRPPRPLRCKQHRNRLFQRGFPIELPAAAASPGLHPPGRQRRCPTAVSRARSSPYCGSPSYAPRSGSAPRGFPSRSVVTPVGTPAFKGALPATRW